MQIEYDKLIEEALKGMVRRLLLDVVKSGLPGDHHFYITFRTDAPGVAIADTLRERWPEEMTIVLQHQFWDLKVGADSFSVTLSFNQTPQVLTVPYAALTAFADPHAKFGLQFALETGTEGDGEPEAPPPETPPAAQTGAGNVVSIDRFRKR